MDVARQEAQERSRQRALAAARFSEDNHRMVIAQLKTDPVHRSHHSLCGAEGQPQILHPEQRSSAHRVLNRGLKTRSRAKPTSAKPAPVNIRSSEGASTQ